MSPIRARLGVTLVGALVPLSFAAPAGAQSNSCAGAAPVGPGTYSGTTVGATTDGASSCGSTATAPDVWFRYNAASDCVLRVTTCGSGYDTVVSVHTACPGSAGNEVACNDDEACGATPYSSVVQVNALAAHTYYIRLAGWNGDSGSYTLTLTCGAPPPPSPDDCVRATPVSAGTYTGSTVGAQNDGSSSCGQTDTTPDVWFSFTPPTACLLIANTCGSGYDTVLSVHTGCPGTAANELACNDDTGGFCAPGGLGSTVQVPGAAGQTYYLRVAGWNGATGAFTLNVDCQPSVQSDSCADATEVAPGTYFGDTGAASADGVSSCDRPEPPPSDMWFRYTALENCNLRVNTCSSAAGADTLISVHTACPGTIANQVACNDDDCGTRSNLLVNALAGQTYYIRVAAYSATTAFALTFTCNPPQADGADVYVGEINQFVQFGRLGDTVGCALDSPLCNAGNQPLDWFGNPDPRHPFAVFNLYRLSPAAGGVTRFEQLGQSWVKHGFGAGQDNVCGFGCTPNPDSTRLGVGCSDSYDAGTNGAQSLLGPRHEINPWTGAFDYASSHFNTPQPPHTAISHRLQLHDADINPAANPGAQYIAEVYIAAHDDANHLNSAAYEPVNISGVPGGVWNFDVAAGASVNGLAISGWPGSSRTVIPDVLTTDGRCFLAVRVTDLGTGRWHYEYALYNHDMDRAVAAFSVPIGGAGLSNIGFHAVASHDEGEFNNSPWTPTVAGGRITWATGSFGSPTSNPVRWGTLYNFRFDADRPPLASTATLTPYKPGGPAAFTGATQAPGAACAPDFNSDGVVNSQDFFDFLAAFFGSAPAADFNRDGVVNSQDFFDYLTAFFAGCG